MLHSILNFIECKASNDGHISEDPVILSCGYSACRKCCKSKISINCFQCNKAHSNFGNRMNFKNRANCGNQENLKTNILIQNMIETNIDQLTIEMAKKIESRKNDRTKSLIFKFNFIIHSDK